MNDIGKPGACGKLMLVAINYWPELTGIGKYTGEMAEWLVRQGYEVNVITAPPYYPAWQVSEGYTSWCYRREVINGVEIFRCPLWVPSRPSGLKRILHLASFAITAMPVMIWRALSWRPDIVFVVEPPLFCAPLALLASKIAGGKSWLHVQDFEVDAAFELGILKSRFLQRMVLSAEHFMMRRFDRASTISEKMLERLHMKGVRKDALALFPNWSDLDVVRPLVQPSQFLDEWSLADKGLIVLYSGNMGEKQGLEILVDVARKLEGRGIHFVMCGDGAAKSRLESYAQGLTNITFRPLQPIEKLNDLLGLADVHVLPQRADAADLVLPSKLTNMLASGRPVVATANPDTQVAVIVEECGLITSPGDPEQLAEAIRSLAENSVLREKMGRKARILAEELWEMDKVLKRAFGSGA